MNNGFLLVNHVGITVSNLEKSIEFYETLTGKKISNKDEIGGKRMAQTQGLDIEKCQKYLILLTSP